jgi:hypothetical protein
MRTSLIFLCLAILAVMAFQASRNVPPPVTLGSVEGSYSFGAPSADGTPGLDSGSIYFGGKRVVLWVNGRKAEAQSRTTAAGISCNGTITRTEGEPVDFSYSITSETSGAVVIGGKTFNLLDGNLFLVDCTTDETRVKQLKRDFHDVQFAVGADTGKNIRKSQRDDNDIRSFFDPHSQYNAAVIEPKDSQDGN